MVALRRDEIEKFLARPDAARPIVLVYGPDSGLVRERAEMIIRASVDDLQDPFALVPMEGDALSSEPSRLLDEAHTIPLFGTRRALWVKGGNRNFAPAVEALAAAPPTDCRVVIEAGDLRRTAPLRTVCEKARNVAVIPCHPDAEADLTRLVNDEMRQAGLTIAPEASAALVSLIGGDRQASRNEIRKLALYAHGKARVELDDVMAVVADASALALDAAVDAAFVGRAAEVETHFSKAMAAGTSSGTIMFAALRHVTQLHKVKLAIEGGDNPEMAMRAFVPPVHFRREAKVKSALNGWSATRLAHAMEQLADISLNVRRTPALADALAQRALLSIAQAARRR